MPQVKPALDRVQGAPRTRRPYTVAVAGKTRTRASAGPRTCSFVAVIEPRGIVGPWCHVFFPPEATRLFGVRGQVPIRMRVEGVEFRLTARPDGRGGHFIQFNTHMRQETGKHAGQSARFEVEVDEAPPPVELPEELRAALHGDPEARAAFEVLAPSHRRSYADFVGEAKGEGTRARRVEKALAMLREGPRRREKC